MLLRRPEQTASGKSNVSAMCTRLATGTSALCLLSFIYIIGGSVFLLDLHNPFRLRQSCVWLSFFLCVVHVVLSRRVFAAHGEWSRWKC